MAAGSRQGQGTVGPRRSTPWLRLIFFLVLVAVSALLHFEKQRWQKQALSAAEQSSLAARAMEFENVKARRGRFYETVFYLGHAWKSSYAVADFIGRLSGAVRPGRILDLRIDPGLRDLDFSLTFAMPAADREPARRAFVAFRQRLQEIAEITRLSFSESAPMEKGVAAKRVYLFSVSGQAEM
jgi:hypothetical protein